MKIHDNIKGFEVVRIEEVKEIHGDAYYLKHLKSGAQLLWLKRDDSNKTFAITFKTIPDDDTGIFHILEHSVLNGSQKYPVREPFVELLKGSMNTFLNAMTFPDKTMYPVGSRNDKEFLNLIDVYLDAVLYPTITSKKETFLQEGWHYELFNKEDELKYNGVVYNEMKGAYSSVDTLLATYLDKMLFPDNCYGYSSGGDPDYIPTLSYEKFLAMHARYYHPSNAKIILDGDMNIIDVLAKIDDVLKNFDTSTIDNNVKMQEPVKACTNTYYYPIKENEDDHNKTNIVMGKILTDYTNKKELVATSIIFDVLASSASSPLKKKVIDTNLVEDMDLSVDNDGGQQSTVSLVLRNTEADNLSEIKEVIKQTIIEIQKQGLDKEAILGSLNTLEFITKQREYDGSTPKGVMFAVTAMESWLYGDDALQNFCFQNIFSQLHEQMNTGYFEELMGKIFLDEEHIATVILKPSKTMEKEKQECLKAKLAEIKSSWSNQEIESVILMNEKLRKIQQTEDSAEDLAKLPVLKKTDLDNKYQEKESTITKINDNEVLFYQSDTEGITHCNLYFNINDLSIDELKTISFISSIIGAINTSKYDAMSLQSKIKQNLGLFYTNCEAYTKGGKIDCTPYFVVSMSMLDEKKELALELVKEIMLNTLFDDEKLIYSMIRQQKLGNEQALISNGNGYAIRRIASHSSTIGAVQEYFMGYEQIKFIDELNDKFMDNYSEYLSKWKKLLTKVISRNRLTVGYVGQADPTFITHVLDSFVPLEKGDPTKLEPLEGNKEGIEIPSMVSYAAMGGFMPTSDEMIGKIKVVTKILTYNYLWNEIRVQNGAYGTGCVISMNKYLVFYSYRDSRCANSLECYRHASDYLHQLELSNEELTKSIIGTLADMEPVLSDRGLGKRAESRYFSGINNETIQNIRNQILNTTMADIYLIADLIKEVCDKDAVCVVGGKKLLEDCSKENLKIISK